MTEGTQQFVFAALATAVVLSALMVVTVRNIVHAAFWLVPTFGTIAGIYLTLSSQLMFGIQLLIYVGAITVLILFALMLTQSAQAADASAPNTAHNRQVAWAGLGSLLLAGVVVWTIVRQVWLYEPLAAELPYEVSVKAVGAALFGEYVLVLEGAAILLLAATIAAITLARKEVDA